MAWISGYCFTSNTGCLFAGFQLLLVILQQNEHVLGQHHDGKQVDQRHHAHGQVGHVPYQRRAADSTKAHHEQYQQSEGQHHALVILDELDVAFGVSVVTDDGAEAEQEQRNGQEVATPAAQCGAQCGLGQLYAFQFGTRYIGTGQQHDKGRAGAHDDGVDEDTEHLDDALASRVSGGCRRRCVRCRAHAGFVGEQTALDAHHHRLAHGVAGKATCSLLQTEGALHDQHEDGRYFRQIGEDDEQRSCPDRWQPSPVPSTRPLGPLCGYRQR